MANLATAPRNPDHAQHSAERRPGGRRTQRARRGAYGQAASDRLGSDMSPGAPACCAIRRCWRPARKFRSRAAGCYWPWPTQKVPMRVTPSNS